MSATGRPEGEYRSAQHEGAPPSATGRPEGEYRSAQHEGAPPSAKPIASSPARRVVLIAGCVAIAGVAGYALYRVGLDRGQKMPADAVALAQVDLPAVSAAPGEERDSAAGRKVLYWHDPMMPGKRFDKPGKSPFMDMALVPVYADAAGEDGAVSISPRVQQNLGVRTAEVQLGVLGAKVEVVGSVAYNERDMAVVQARSNGFLEHLYVRATLDPVRRGQPLAELYMPDWVAAQEEFLTARRIAEQGSAKVADGLVDAARQRMRLVGMSEDQVRRIEARGIVQTRTTVTAPIDGVVTELAAREGMTVMVGAPLFRINGLSTIWVNAEVPENVAPNVRLGHAVEARASALPGTVFHGKVSAILPEVNPATRTMKARVELANPGHRLVPGMFATLDFAPSPSGGALLVPSEAVIQTGKRTVVVVAQDDGRFAPVEVEVGLEGGGRTEVRKGLRPGQKVVVSGQFLVDSEANLRTSAARMSDPPATAPSMPGDKPMQPRDDRQPEARP